MRNSSAAAALGPAISYRRIVSAPSQNARPHNFAMSAAERGLPIAAPRSTRSCFSSGRSLGRIKLAFLARVRGVPAAENSSLPAGRQDLPRRDLRHRVLLGLSISRHSGAGGLSGGFRFRGRRSARDLLRGRIQLGKGLSRLVDERSVCQHRRARRNNGRQAGIDHNALGPSVSRFNADDGFVYRRVPNEALRGIGQVPVRHEQHRKEQASDKKEVST